MHSPLHLLAGAEYLGLVGAGALAWRYGDDVVRAAAMAVLGPGLLAWVLIDSPDHLFVPYMDASAAFVCADAVSLALMLAVALRRGEPPLWLSFACAFQIVTVAAHFVRVFDPAIRIAALAAVANGSWVLQVAAVLWGALEAQTRSTERRSLA